MEQIQYIIDFYQLSASQLADRLGIQRSTISHLLTGRNKPSLDILRKITKAFPELNEAWLLSGHGSPLKAKEADRSILVEQNNVTGVNDSEESPEYTSVTKQDNSGEKPKKFIDVNNEDVAYLIVVYRDGTYESIRPRK